AAAVPPIPHAVVADHPASGIGRAVGVWIDGTRSGHDADSFGLEETGNIAESVDVIEELDEAGGRGDPASVGVHAGDVHVVRVFVVLAVVNNLVGSALAQGVAGDAHVSDAAGGEDIGLD